MSEELQSAVHDEADEVRPGEDAVDPAEAPDHTEAFDADAEGEDVEPLDDEADDDDETGADDEAAGSDPAGEPRTTSKRGEALTTEGEIAADYLEELLDIADLDGDIDTYNEGGRAHVSLITDSDVLVGKNGEVLDALQELARLAVMTETGHRSRLMLDIAGHRDKQRAGLQDLAADAVASVRATGEPARLAPMNPYQRKIVHDAIAAAGLVSESEGEEPNRRVVVWPKA